MALGQNRAQHMQQHTVPVNDDGHSSQPYRSKQEQEWETY